LLKLLLAGIVNLRSNLFGLVGASVIVFLAVSLLKGL